MSTTAEHAELQEGLRSYTEMLGKHNSKLNEVERDLVKNKARHNEATSRIKLYVEILKRMRSEQVTSLSEWKEVRDGLKKNREMVTKERNDLLMQNLLRERVRREIRTCESLIEGIQKRIAEFGRVVYGVFK